MASIESSLYLPTNWLNLSPIAPAQWHRIEQFMLQMLSSQTVLIPDIMMAGYLALREGLIIGQMGEFDILRLKITKKFSEVLLIVF